MSFDLERLLVDVDGDLERLRGPALEFVSQIPVCMIEVRKRVEEERLESLASWCRSLASTFSALLAVPASEAAQALQIAAERADPDRVVACACRLEGEVQVLLTDVAHVFQIVV